jgi:hypothetical protein
MIGGTEQRCPEQPRIRAQADAMGSIFGAMDAVIAEAGEGSGSISQGWEALRLGRHLFIMETVATDASLSWPGEMRKYGAEVLGETDQLFEVLPLDMGGALAPATACL